MNLYNIANEYVELLEKSFDSETGEINEVVLYELNEVKESVEKKSIALASYIKNIEAEKKAIEEAKKEMDKRESTLKNKVEYLTQYLQTNMEKCEINEIKCPYFKIRLKKCPVSVKVLDESLIGEEYKRTKVEISIDKMKLKEELLAGVVIPGVVLHQNNKLEIR